jgi:phosphate starvation-inducible PhoH-like protein
MVGELERMLHMLPSQSSWEVPVVATQATNDVGIAELLDAIQNHREHRGAHVEPDGLRQARRREVYDIVEEELAARLRRGMDEGTFQDILARVDRGESDYEDGEPGGNGVAGLRIALPGIRKVIQPKTAVQAEYLRMMQDNDIVVGIGPAGTGKTYLAVAAAVDALTRKRVRRIVLARPAVEAGESLGFLPGDMQAKVDPYLRPLYDALDDMMPFDRIQRALEQRVIEVAPLAFMRGRTLGDAFVIVDEAQNATTMQMKMLLTRLGVNSKMVITGDKTQVDLPKREDSGLMQVERILPGIDGIGFHYFTEVDVVRHRLVRDIVRAYAADAGE